MMSFLATTLLVIAFVLFVIAATYTSPRFNLIAIGLASVALSMLILRIPIGG